MADSLKALDLAKVEALHPEIIISEIGSNDLCALGSCPKSVGSNIENLLSLLHHQYGSAFVIVCQVIHRKRFPPIVSITMPKSTYFYKYLHVVLEPLTYAEVWCHKGIKEPNIQVLCHDGIHLNDEGNYALYHSHTIWLIMHVQHGISVTRFAKHVADFFTFPIRVFIRHRRSENSPATTQNSPAKFRWPVVIFLFRHGAVM